MPAFAKWTVVGPAPSIDTRGVGRIVWPHIGWGGPGAVDLFDAESTAVIAFPTCRGALRASLTAGLGPHFWRHKPSLLYRLYEL